MKQNINSKGKRAEALLHTENAIQYNDCDYCLGRLTKLITNAISFWDGNVSNTLSCSCMYEGGVSVHCSGRITKSQLHHYE